MSIPRCFFLKEIFNFCGSLPSARTFLQLEILHLNFSLLFCLRVSLSTISISNPVNPRTVDAPEYRSNVIPLFLMVRYVQMKCWIVLM